MFRWLMGKEHRQQGSAVLSGVAHGLQEAYQEKLLPLERDYDFSKFYSKEPLTDADFSSRPMVLLLGQYSTGKTSLIRHLLGRDYPGLRIGPEPTTEKFVAVTHGDSNRDLTIRGHTLVSDPAMPFTQLGNFGDGFLSKFECVKIKSPVLEGMTLIDTPGVLAGEKQRLNRSYNFEEVTSWFADRVDTILLLFDVSKLDISDELRRIITSLRGNEHKLKIILNKADYVTTPQLMRVYGALTWSLGKIIDAPEMSRVYVGSFWDGQLQNSELTKLFAGEEDELYEQLAQLPRSAAVNKLNELVRRARLVKLHAHLMSALRSKLSSFWRRNKAQQELIASLRDIYQEVSRAHQLPLGDFPEVVTMQEKLSLMDFMKFPMLDPKKLQSLEEVLTHDIPELLELVPEEQDQATDAAVAPVRRVSRASKSRSRSRRREGDRGRNASRSLSQDSRRGTARTRGGGGAAASSGGCHA